jgi:plasmid stability protein
LLYLEQEAGMATLQVRDMDDRLYAFLKNTARMQNRSISQEVITIIQNYVNSNHTQIQNTTQEFLSMTGAWIEEGTAEEIIKEIKKGRKVSGRFGANDVLFD